jgi:starch phosphorylase
MTADEVTEAYRTKTYRPMDLYEQNEDLRRVIDQLTNGFFDNVPTHEFQEIRDRLLHQDAYFVLQDFASYQEAHMRANELYKDPDAWFRAAIINIAKSGYFSSDRTIAQYIEDIWHIHPITKTTD